jgi:hypothetical protein
MAFKEYGQYDGIGLADLVRRKHVSARELLDEAITRSSAPGRTEYRQFAPRPTKLSLIPELGR